MEIKKVKIYGERNTGTNYLSRLIAINLHIRQLRGIVPNSGFWRTSEFTKNLYFSLHSNNTLGWKHQLVSPQRIVSGNHTTNIGFVTLTKNPYSFLLSLYKRPYHYKGARPGSFYDFLSSKWYLQKRDNCKKPYYNNPIELWNFKNRSYMDLKIKMDLQTINLTYEGLLADPEIVIENIASFFNLKK